METVSRLLLWLLFRVSSWRETKPCPHVPQQSDVSRADGRRLFTLCVVDERWQPLVCERATCQGQTELVGRVSIYIYKFNDANLLPPLTKHRHSQKPSPCKQCCCYFLYFDRCGLQGRGSQLKTCRTTAAKT